MHNRSERQELRKRGAATRKLTTDEVLIKTPKQKQRHNQWASLSRDSGALITEELSQQFSPEVSFRNRSFELEDYEEEAEEVDEDDINEYEEEQYLEEQEDNALTAKSQEETLKLLQQYKNREEQRKKKKNKNQSRKINQSSVPEKVTKKSKSKKASNEKIRQKGPVITKSSDLSINSDYEDTGENGNDNDDNDDDNGEYFEEEEREEEHLQSLKTIIINRLPTTSNRLTSIDVIIHLLEYYQDSYLNSKSALPPTNFNDLQDFFNTSILDFKELLDLNLSNNQYIYNLRSLKSEKQDARNKLFELKKDTNQKLQELDRLRFEYHQLRDKLKLQKRINENLQKISSNSEKQTETKEIWQKINELNKVLDPNWGLLQKLKAVNTKLYGLDQKL